MTLAQHLDAISFAADADALEELAQQAWKAYPRSHGRIDQEVWARGRELCAVSPHTRLLPIVRKRRQIELGTETYSVGFGQNSAGERYVWHFADEWVRAHLIAAGLEAEVVADVLSWYRLLPHRALRAIESAYSKGDRP